MRIIAGAFKGRRLKIPRRDVRPTTDMVREAAFNILAAEIPDARVVDLFAGSGSMGLEALSRGASSVDFVEISRSAEKVLQDNINLLGGGDRTAIVRGDVLGFVRKLPAHRYDVAFADPPYGEGLAGRLRDLFLEVRFAKILCVEHRVGELEDADDVRRYGETQLSFFRDE